MKQKDSKEFHDNQSLSHSFLLWSIRRGEEAAGVSREKRGLTIKQYHAKAFYASIYLFISASLLTCLFSYYSHCARGRRSRAGERHHFWLTNRIKVIAKHTQSCLYDLTISISIYMAIKSNTHTPRWSHRQLALWLFSLWTMDKISWQSVRKCVPLYCVCVSMLDHRLKLESFSALV